LIFKPKKDWSEAANLNARFSIYPNLFGFMRRQPKTHKVLASMEPKKIGFLADL